MKLRQLLLFAVLLIPSIPAPALDNKLTPQEEKAGWILLFDGQSFDGWTTSNFTQSKTPIQDGSINPHRCGAYMMMHEKDWSDFILSLDFKTSERCNSGIFLRTHPLIDVPGQGVGYYGIEVAIDESEDTGYHASGALYDLVPVAKKVSKSVGEWNHVVITCDKNLISVVLNGQETAHMNLDEWINPGKRPDGTAHKFSYAFKDHSRKGRIGLQDHGHPVWFKNIKIKPLDLKNK